MINRISAFVISKIYSLSFEKLLTAEKATSNFNQNMKNANKRETYTSTRRPRELATQTAYAQFYNIKRDAAAPNCIISFLAASDAFGVFSSNHNGKCIDDYVAFIQSCINNLNVKNILIYEIVTNNALRIVHLMFQLAINSESSICLFCNTTCGVLVHFTLILFAFPVCNVTNYKFAIW
ncbi:hypothetical protein T10_9617 [Trichinella papuae]|uniref:Uncharacterized protein n=1 Tax=Trichinella papuae TaxID=268474 RepID=A0A0V1MIJ7_9BILA|nr:hypothetical protein T10_9617 [Trichinella papuae]